MSLTFNIRHYNYSLLIRYEYCCDGNDVSGKTQLNKIMETRNQTYKQTNLQRNLYTEFPIIYSLFFYSLIITNNNNNNSYN